MSIHGKIGVPFFFHSEPEQIATPSFRESLVAIRVLGDYFRWLRTQKSLKKQRSGKHDQLVWLRNVWERLAMERERFPIGIWSKTVHCVIKFYHNNNIYYSTYCFYDNEAHNRRSYVSFSGVFFVCLCVTFSSFG